MMRTSEPCPRCTSPRPPPGPQTRFTSGFAALKAGGLRFRAVFFSESAQGQVERLMPQIGAHVETVLLPDKLFSSTVPSDAPQGVAALVRLRQSSFEDALARIQSGPLVVIAGLQDPGNLGSGLRSAEAFGAAGMLLGEGTVSPFNSKWRTRLPN